MKIIDSIEAETLLRNSLIIWLIFCQIRERALEHFNKTISFIQEKPDIDPEQGFCNHRPLNDGAKLQSIIYCCNDGGTTLSTWYLPVPFRFIQLIRFSLDDHLSSKHGFFVYE